MGQSGLFRHFFAGAVSLLLWPGAMLLTPGLAVADEPLRIVQALDRQRLALSDGTIWNLRRLHVLDALPVEGVVVETGPFITNRYGEQIGNLFDLDGVWLQERWIRDGLALVDPVAGFDDDYPALLAAEASPGVLEASWLEANPFAKRGTFAIVQGVVKAAVSGQSDDQSIIYLNFGEDYKSDFTATISPPVYAEFRRLLKKRKMKLADMAGRTIRVRGLLGLYNGPSIALTHSQAIEFPEDATE